MTERTKVMIRDVMDNVRADKHPLTSYQYVGKRGVQRLDGLEKANGKAVYAMDDAGDG